MIDIDAIRLRRALNDHERGRNGLPSQAADISEMLVTIGAQGNAAEVVAQFRAMLADDHKD